MRRATLVSVLVIFLYAVAVLYAVAAMGKTISGTVTDKDDNPIAKATVVIENTKTHREITIETDHSGRFIARNLKGKDYSVLVVAESSSNGVRLRLDAENGPREGHGISSTVTSNH